MRIAYPSQGLLSSWALLGLLTMLCAPWVLPTNKLYHQALIFLLWLPGLLALAYAGFRRLLLQPEMVLFLLLAVWTLLLAVSHAGGETLNEFKLPFYVFLFLLGILAAAQHKHYSIEQQLLVAAVVAGPFALWSLIDFYLISETNGRRVIAVGLWDKIIMAAHAVGALTILGLLLGGRPNTKGQWLLCLGAGLPLAAFLLMSQTRGVWLALLASLVVVVLARPTRVSLSCLGLAAVSVLLLALCAPEFLAQRGFSYRPELLLDGLRLLGDNWSLGLGFNDYWILIESNGLRYRHPHNLYLDTGIRWGVVGLVLFIVLWGTVAWRAWSQRKSPLGLALLGLWTFSSVALMSDGIGLWFKPNADWLITWLPVALSLVLAARVVHPAVECSGANALEGR